MTLPRTICLTLRETPERWIAGRARLKASGLDPEPYYGVYGPKFGISTAIPYEGAKQLFVPCPGGASRCWDLTGRIQYTDGYNYLGPVPLSIFLGHYSIWAACQLLSDDSVLILEDDAIFDDDWKTRYDQAMSNLPENWDFLFLGSCCADGYDKTKISDNLFAVTSAMCLHAYMIRKKAVPVLLETMSYLWQSVDIQLTFNAFPKLNVYAILPRLAVQADTVTDA